VIPRLKRQKLNGGTIDQKNAAAERAVLCTWHIRLCIGKPTSIGELVLFMDPDKMPVGNRPFLLERERDSRTKALMDPKAPS
jgi:hypothetical protein